MFTGIVNEIGKIVSIEKQKKNNIFTVKLSSISLEGLQIGASVAHNGCCLTVTYIDDHTIICNAVEETLTNTNLGTLSIGDYINIERSVKYGEEIGGHIISGHITNTIKIFKIKKNHDNYILWLQVRNIKLMKYIFYKGFVCLDGISLTVSNVVHDKFCVNIIPHTLLSTTIQYKKNGDSMNIEIDFYTQTIVDTTERILERNMKSFL